MRQPEIARRTLLRTSAAAVVSAAAGAMGLTPVEAADGHGIPCGYEHVDPRTARKVPLTLSLRAGAPIYPGDPEFRFEPDFIDTRTPDNRSGGYLLERIDEMGTHTASHISAPVHFIVGGRRLDEIGEEWTLMPLAVVDLRPRISRDGAEFQVSRTDLVHWERRHGRIPRRGCVLLLTGHATLYAEGAGETSPYITDPTPGFSGAAVDWLFTSRRILAVGADAPGPDASSDPELQATTQALARGGITVENVGPGLAQMRPHGDWININGNRPPFSGFQTGFTGYTKRQS
jgi:kynurenine formamidase